jgi:hypothetical protein
MIVLDENVIRSQREILLAHRISLRQVGIEIGRKRMDDAGVLAVLMRLKRPTFFTSDSDFYDRTLRHRRYCLVLLECDASDVARFVRRVLAHPELNTQARRCGHVIRASENQKQCGQSTHLPSVN